MKRTPKPPGTAHHEQCICVACVQRRKQQARRQLPSFGMPDVKACAPGDDCTLEDLGRYHIKLVLEKSSSLGAAAKTLGIDAATLYRKRRRASESC